MTRHPLLSETIAAAEANWPRTITSERTRAEYRSVWTMFLAAHPKIRVDVVTRKLADRWVRTMEAGGLSPATVNMRLAAMAALMGILRRAGIDNSPRANPFSRAEVERCRNPRRVPRTVSEEGFAALVKACQTAEERAVVYLMGHGGLRISEVAALKTSDIFDGYLIVIGKGNKERKVHFSEPLTEAIRTFTEGMVGNRPLFGHPDGRTKRLRKLVNAIVARANVTAEGHRVTPHTLRKYCARLLSSGGLDILHVAKHLGHANVNTTTIYTNGSDDRIKDTLTQIG